jgi:hypothetical protein
MFAAGCFIYGSVLCLQGLAARLLPRRWFLRTSSYLQIVVVCLLVIVYFQQPFFADLSEMVDPEKQRLLAWLPSYWFLAALQQLNGSQLAVLVPLARRAWLGLAIVLAGRPSPSCSRGFARSGRLWSIPISSRRFVAFRFRLSEMHW